MTLSRLCLNGHSALPYSTSYAYQPDIGDGWETDCYLTFQPDGDM